MGVLLRLLCLLPASLLACPLSGLLSVGRGGGACGRLRAAPEQQPEVAAPLHPAAARRPQVTAAAACATSSSATPPSTLATLAARCWTRAAA